LKFICSEDRNPIHFDQTYAEKTIFKKCIVHGFLSGSLVSAVAGSRLPGPGSIYNSLQETRSIYNSQQETLSIYNSKQEGSIPNFGIPPEILPEYSVFDILLQGHVDQLPSVEKFQAELIGIFGDTKIELMKPDNKPLYLTIISKVNTYKTLQANWHSEIIEDILGFKILGIYLVQEQYQPGTSIQRNNLREKLAKISQSLVEDEWRRLVKNDIKRGYITANYKIAMDFFEDLLKDKVISSVDTGILLHLIYMIGRKDLAAILETQ